MINVMQDDSFQFKAKQPYGYTYNPYRPSRRYLEDSASPSTNDSYRQPHQHGGRGDGRSRRRRNTGRGRSRTNGASSSGANNAHNGNATNGNSRNGGSGAPPNSRSHSRSRSSSRSFARGHADYDDGYRGPGYAGYDEYDTNGYGYRASSSYYSSSSRSHSRSRSYDDDEDIDEIDRSRLEGEEGDASFSLDPAEEARLRRLQGPKLNARILPLPSKQIELDEEEERARRGEELFNRGMGQGPGGPVERERERARLRALRHRPRNGTGAGDDDLTPMQEAPGMDFSVADSTATNGNGNGHTDAPVETVVSADGLTKSLATTAGIPRAMFVEELNQADHDAVNRFAGRRTLEGVRRRPADPRSSENRTRMGWIEFSCFLLQQQRFILRFLLLFQGSHDQSGPDQNGPVTQLFFASFESILHSIPLRLSFALTLTTDPAGFLVYNTIPYFSFFI
ncbi:hypothetical protein DL93DRAFT_465908 [Clavulina sp. PMI_390]|nr:hypothetical protein DL93DRAFT_465908 [Clavulina sp. PMI_390]